MEDRGSSMVTFDHICMCVGVDWSGMVGSKPKSLRKRLYNRRESERIHS